MKTKVCYILYILFVLITLRNTNLNAAQQTLYFSNLRFENGLPSSVTSSIVQDKAGFIWIGTDEGLCRYDGYSMINFTKGKNNNSLPSNRISALLLDDDKLWVATWNGLCTINTQTFEIKNITTGNIHVFRSLYKDCNGNIWIGSANGVLVYSPKKDKFEYYCSSNSSLSNNTIRSFYQDANGVMWIGTYDKLNSFDGHHFTSYDLKGNLKPDIHNNLILSIVPHPKDSSLLWVGTETGLCLFNKKFGSYSVTNTQNSSLSNDVIKCIYSDNKNDKLWLGTDFGLNIYDNKNQKVTPYYHNPNINYTISNNVVISIYKDNSDLLWFITSNGVSVLNNSSSSYVLHELSYSENNINAGNQIRSILVQPDKTIWTATTHGVVKLMPNGKKFNLTMKGPAHERLILDNCNAIVADQKNRIWIGTAGGINIWDEQKRKLYAITASKNNGLTSNYIKQIKTTANGNIWISAWDGGVFQVYGDKNTPEDLSFLPISNDSEALITTLNNHLYFTSHDILWQFNPQSSDNTKLTQLSNNNGINDITCITSDNLENIWMGRKDGLWKYNTTKDSLIYYPFKTLKQNTLLGIEVDSRGFIWVSTHNTVYKYTNEGQLVNTIPLDTNTPIKNFVNQCSTTSKSGSVYFGGDNGYIEIISDSIKENNTNQKPIISGFYINNQLINPIHQPQILKTDIAYTKSLKLEYENNSIAFEFSNLYYWLNDRNSFRYKLVGFDENWIYTNSNKAIYSNLTPGSYEFLLASDSPAGNINAPITKVNITIKRPFWLGNFFLALYALIIILILYATFRIIKYRYKLNNELHIAQIEKEHSEQILDVRQNFFTNVSHEFRTPLSLIVPPIKQVLNNGTIDENSKKLLQLAERNSKRLMSLVNQILDFSKLEKNSLILQKKDTDIIAICQSTYETFRDMATRNEIDYQITYPTKSIVINIDAAKIETILFNLLSNAFKFTPVNGTIRFDINIDQDSLCIAVSDSGIGISAEEQKLIFERYYQSKDNTKLGSGIGLAIAKDYASLHHGTLNVDSLPNQGSTFTLELPLDKDKLNIEEYKPTVITTPKTQLKQDANSDKDKKTLLIIDDNPDILEFITLNLQDQYRLLNATNGTEGYEIAIKHEPQLIVSDVMMPGLDGFELCTKLKSDNKTNHIPIILLTAKGMNTQKVEGMNRGADMYITKPFETDYLISCIESIFRRESFTIQYSKNLLITSPDKPSDEADNQDEKFLKKVMTIVETNIQNPSFSVEILSEEIGISSTHLYRKLKALTGHSTQEIIKNYRLKKAAQMLENNEGNISEIMYKVGFSNLSTFSKRFKAEFGVAPSDYAKNK